MIVKRNRMYLTVALVALLALVTSVAYAGGRYDDTSSNTANCTAAYPCGGESGIVRNGTFDPGLWSADSVPTGWSIWLPQKSGWERNNVSMNMATVHDTANGRGMNDGLAFFVRNTGGEGPFNVYATQALAVPAAGYYWVEVHSSMFGEFFTDGGDSYHNALAWYGIGKSDGNPNSVATWREMAPMGTDHGKRPCPNSAQNCRQVGRYETIWLEPGDVLYLRAGHKWSTFNNWTVFEFDDIVIRSADSSARDDSGWWDVGGIGWNKHGSR